MPLGVCKEQYVKSYCMCTYFFLYPVSSPCQKHSIDKMLYPRDLPETKYNEVTYRPLPALIYIISNLN